MKNRLEIFVRYCGCIGIILLIFIVFRIITKGNSKELFASPFSIPEPGFASIHNIKFVNKQSTPIFNIFSGYRKVLQTEYIESRPVEEVWQSIDVIVWSFDWRQKLLILARIRNFTALQRHPFLDRGIRRILQRNDELLAIRFSDVEDKFSSDFDWSKVNWVWNTGRCGSTLLHRALLETGNIHSFKEPQYIDDMTYRHPESDAVYEEKLHFFMRADMHFVKNRNPKITHFSFNPKNQVHFIKFVGQSPIFKPCKHIFLYREISEVVNSFGTVFSRGIPLPAKWLSYYFDIPLYQPQLRHEQMKAAWGKLKDRYPKTYPPSMNIFAGVLENFLWWSDAKVNDWIPNSSPTLHFQQLKDVNLRNEVLKQLFAYWGVTADSERCLAVFEKDSQAGSPMSRSASNGKEEFMKRSDFDVIETLAQEFHQYEIPLLHPLIE